MHFGKWSVSPWLPVMVCALWRMDPQAVAPVLMAAAVHEGGHLLAVALTGGTVRRIHLSAWGAVLDLAPMECKQRRLCALAGPLAGLLLLLAWPWWKELAVFALGQSLFNLLPVEPLDGGRIWKRTGEK